MSKKVTNRYSKEFRIEAVKMVIEGSVSPYEASRQQSLPKSTLENRVRQVMANLDGNCLK